MDNRAITEDDWNVTWRDLAIMIVVGLFYAMACLIVGTVLCLMDTVLRVICRRRWAAACLALLLIWGAYARGATYYVDPAQPDDTGDGLTPATAKKTIAAAVTAAAGGSTINLLAGTHVIAAEIAFTKQLIFQGAASAIVTPPAADDAFSLGTNTSGTQFHDITFTGGDYVGSTFIDVVNSGLTGLVLSDCTFIDCLHRPLSTSSNPSWTVTRCTFLRCRQYVYFTNGTATWNYCLWVDCGHSVTAAGNSVFRLSAGTYTFNNCVLLGGHETTVNGTIRLDASTVTMNNCVLAGMNRTGVDPAFVRTTGTVTLNNCIWNGSSYRANDTISITGVTQNSCLNNVIPGFVSALADDAIFTYCAIDSLWIIGGTDYLSPMADVFAAAGVHMTFFPDDCEDFLEAHKVIMRDFHDDGHDLGVYSQSSSRIDLDSPFYVSYSGAGANPRVVIAVTDETTASLICRTDSGDDLTLNIAKTATNKYIGTGTSQTYSVMKTVNDHADWTCNELQAGLYDDAYAYCLASGTYAISGNTDIPWDTTRLWNEEITLSKALIEAVIGEGWTASSYNSAVVGSESDEDVADAIKAAGFSVARTYTGSPLSLSSVADIWNIGNSETNLTATNLRGAGYDALSDAQKEARIRSSARALSVTMRLYGLWISYGTSPTTPLTTTEMGWFLDELLDNGVRVLSFKEAQEYIASTSTPASDGYTRTLGTTIDLSLQAGSPCIDAGTDLGDGTLYLDPDGLNQDLYGAGWEIGAYVYRPAVPLKRYLEMNRRR